MTLFYSDEVIFRFPSKVRFDKFACCKWRFCCYYFIPTSCLAISRFSDLSWDFEAKPWDCEIIPRAVRVCRSVIVFHKTLYTFLEGGLVWMLPSMWRFHCNCDLSVASREITVWMLIKTEYNVTHKIILKCTILDVSRVHLWYAFQSYACVKQQHSPANILLNQSKCFPPGCRFHVFWLNLVFVNSEH